MLDSEKIADEDKRLFLRILQEKDTFDDVRDSLRMPTSLLGQCFSEILTGCLRMSKESIFTGLHYFDVNSIVDIEHDVDIFCPRDAIRYTKKLLADSHAEPEAFWINTSGNDLVKRFTDRADKTTQNEIERLIEGEAIEKKLVWI